MERESKLHSIRFPLDLNQISCAFISFICLHTWQILFLKRLYCFNFFFKRNNKQCVSNVLVAREYKMNIALVNVQMTVTRKRRKK